MVDGEFEGSMDGLKKNKQHHHDDDDEGDDDDVNDVNDVNDVVTDNKKIDVTAVAAAQRAVQRKAQGGDTVDGVFSVGPLAHARVAAVAMFDRVWGYLQRQQQGSGAAVKAQ